MSMVPLNFGAAAPLMLNPHLVQVVAVSGFLVPQFGQNKSASEDGASPRWKYSATLTRYTQGHSVLKLRVSRFLSEGSAVSSRARARLREP